MNKMCFRVGGGGVNSQHGVPGGVPVEGGVIEHMVHQSELEAKFHEHKIEQS